MQQEDSPPSPETLKNALTDYYVKKTKILDLRATYAFLENAALLKAFGTYQHTDVCNLCGGHRISLFANRAKITKRIAGHSGLNKKEVKSPLSQKVIITGEGYKVYYPHCQACGHADHAQCDCISCREARAESYQAILETYLKEHCTECIPPVITELDPETSFCLAWFLSFGHLEAVSLSAGKSISTLKNQDLNNMAFSEGQMIERLKKQKIIQADPISLKNAIEMQSLTDHVFHADKLTYKIAYKIDDLYGNIKQHCRQLFQNKKSRSDVIEIMGMLALRDAFTFYHNLSKISGIPFSSDGAVGDLCAHLRFGINKLGLFKTAYAIEKSVRYARTLIVEQRQHPNHAANQARSGLCKHWLNRDDNLRWKSYEKNWDNNIFKESKRTRLFQDLFLPFTVEFGTCPLLSLSDDTQGEIEKVETHLTFEPS